MRGEGLEALYAVSHKFRDIYHPKEGSILDDRNHLRQQCRNQAFERLGQHDVEQGLEEGEALGSSALKLTLGNTV